MIEAQNGNGKVYVFPCMLQRDFARFFVVLGVKSGPHAHLFNTVLSCVPSSAVSFSVHPDQ